MMMDAYDEDTNEGLSIGQIVANCVEFLLEAMRQLVQPSHYSSSTYWLTSLKCKREWRMRFMISLKKPCDFCCIRSVGKYVLCK